jgi:hypothetical protein
LPLLEPTKFKLILNLKNRKGHRPPPTLLARSRDVIE